MLRKFIQKNIIYVEWIILFIYSILLYNNILLLSRIQMMIFYLLGIWTYLLIFDRVKNVHKRKKLSERILKGRVKKYYDNILLKYAVEIERINEIYIKILINIYLYRNLLWVLVKIEIKFFFWFRRVNLKFIKYTWVRVMIYSIIFGFFINPIKLMYLFFYLFLNKLQERTLLELIFRRIIGVITSLIFLTHVIDYVLIYFKFFIIYVGLNNNNICIIIYLFILGYMILYSNIDSSKYLKMYYKDDIWTKIQFWLLFRTSLNFINLLRSKNTIHGLYLRRKLVKLFVKNNKKVLEVYNYKFLLFISEMNEYNEIDHILIEDINMKADIILIVNTIYDLKNEIKNKPFINFQYDLNNFEDHCLRSIIWGLRKEGVKDEVREQLERYLNEIMKFNKYILFKYLDMERYLSNDNNYKSNMAVDEGIYVSCNEYLLDCRKYNNFDMSKPLNENKEKCLDIEDDYEIFLKIKFKITSKSKLNWEREIAQFIDRNPEINCKNVIIHRKNRGENKDLYPYLYDGDDQKEWRDILMDMYDLIYELEKEWKKEVEEGKRNYMWEDWKD